MTFHQLKVFVTVAKLRNFTLAAQTLHVRQPSVSILMQGLQRELDVKLFERLGTKVHLTRAGEELVHRAERILAEVEGIKEGMEEIKGLKKGKLRVGGSAIAAASFLPVVIQAFKKKHPGVDVTLKIQGSESLQKQLLDGDLELAVVARAPHSPLLFSEHYREEEVVVIAPPDHPLARKHSIPLELLARERFVVSKKDSQMRDIVERIFAGRGLSLIPSLELDILFGGRDAIKNAVANGIGISVISKSYVDSDLKTGRLKVLKVPELKFKRTMYITVHKDRQNSPLVQVFKAFLRKYNK